MGSGVAPVKKHIEMVLATDPAASGEFIFAFLSFGRTGNKYMDEAGYDFVVKFVEPEVLMKAFEVAGFHGPDRTDAIGRTAQQFAEIYRSKRGDEPPTDRTA
jgi:hypothetical protein